MRLRWLGLVLLLVAAAPAPARAQPVWTFDGVWTDNEIGDTVVVCYSPDCVPYQVIYFPGPVAILNGASQYWAWLRHRAGLQWPYTTNWNHRCTIGGIPKEIVVPEIVFPWNCINQNENKPSAQGRATTKVEPYQFPDGKIPETLARLFEDLSRTPAPGPKR
jgi:hypothetical protein